MNNDFLEKLKREWKTAAIAVLSAVAFGYESIAHLIDYPQLFGNKAAFVGFAVTASMLLLRKWLDR